MLFLAVFCGFLAEYQLEHKIEKESGKQYIQSVYEDLKEDTAMLANTIATVSAVSGGIASSPRSMAGSRTMPRSIAFTIDCAVSIWNVSEAANEVGELVLSGLSRSFDHEDRHGALPRFQTQTQLFSNRREDGRALAGSAFGPVQLDVVSRVGESGLVDCRPSGHSTQIDRKGIHRDSLTGEPT